MKQRRGRTPEQLVRDRHEVRNVVEESPGRRIGERPETQQVLAPSVGEVGRVPAEPGCAGEPRDAVEPPRPRGLDPCHEADDCQDGWQAFSGEVVTLTEVRQLLQHEPRPPPVHVGPAMEETRERRRSLGRTTLIERDLPHVVGLGHRPQFCDDPLGPTVERHAKGRASEPERLTNALDRRYLEGPAECGREQGRREVAGHRRHHHACVRHHAPLRRTSYAAG